MQTVSQSCLITKYFSSRIAEFSLLWGNQFLQRPTTVEPFALSKRTRTRVERPLPQDIRKIDVASFRSPIPSVHRIDCVGQLRTAGLIDTQSIRPHPVIPMGFRDLSELHGFAEAGAVSLGVVCDDERHEHQAAGPLLSIEVQEFLVTRV